LNYSLASADWDCRWVYVLEMARKGIERRLETSGKGVF
jgi:hypothetical protein